MLTLVTLVCFSKTTQGQNIVATKDTVHIVKSPPLLKFRVNERKKDTVQHPTKEVVKIENPDSEVYYKNNIDSMLFRHLTIDSSIHNLKKDTTVIIKR